MFPRVLIRYQTLSPPNDVSLFQGKTSNLGGGFKHFLFSPLFGEDFQFDYYFSDGLKPPTSIIVC